MKPLKNVDRPTVGNARSVNERVFWLLAHFWQRTITVSEQTELLLQLAMGRKERDSDGNCQACRFQRDCIEADTQTSTFQGFTTTQKE